MEEVLGGRGVFIGRGDGEWQGGEGLGSEWGVGVWYVLIWSIVYSVCIKCQAVDDEAAEAAAGHAGHATADGARPGLEGAQQPEAGASRGEGAKARKGAGGRHPPVAAAGSPQGGL